MMAEPLLLRGSRISIRPLTRADLAPMAAWRPFDDPLHAEANWMHRAPQKLDHWYTRYSQDPRRRPYALEDVTGRLIGCLTLREMDGRRSARLGITLGADFVNQGYGTEALDLFLDYYFEELGFAKMVLDAGAYNQRAIQVYEKLGFEKVARRKRSAGPRKAFSFLREPRYADVRQFFQRDWFGRCQVWYYEMELLREKWRKNRGARNGVAKKNSAAADCSSQRGDPGDHARRRP